MRKILTLVTLTFLLHSYAQENTSSSPSETYTIVEEMPRFKSAACLEAEVQDAMQCTTEEIINFISETVVYPPKCLKKGITGKVFVRFVVNANGKVTNVNIAKGAHKLLNEEAIRVVKEFPDFKPGYQRGKAVAVQYIIPINFSFSQG